MNYSLKEEVSKEFRKKYKNQYIVDNIGMSKTYISLILNRKRNCPKRVAFAITKLIDSKAEITDFFEEV